MKKIFFNDRYGLTKAVLEGRKTMTRRLVPEGAPFGNWEETLKKSCYQLGEVVAVAQNYDEVFDEFATIAYFQLKKFSYLIEPTPDNFKAFAGQSDVTLPKTLPGWYNKMFVRAELMPHQICITNIQVERLQDISEEDCFREGVDVAFQNGHAVSYYRFENSRGHYFTPREAFAGLIDKVSGKGTWERNPWVFVYEFELIK